MKKLSAVLALAFLMGAAPLQAAEGSPFYTWGWTNVCGGNAFATCSTGTVQYSYDGVTTDYFVTIAITNLGGNGELFKAVGLFNLPAVGKKGALPQYYNESTNTAYGPEPPNDFGGSGLVDATIAYVTNTKDDMLHPDPAAAGFISSGTFKFRLSGITQAQLDTIGVGFHAIAGANNCSNKVGFKSDGNGGGSLIPESNPTTYPTNCVPTVVPEPTTVVLLGTGLIGLFGVGYWRRREEEEA